jgi:O-antigen/teichoic acid export membrane protein
MTDPRHTGRIDLPEDVASGASITRRAISGTAFIALASAIGQALTGLAFIVIARRTSPSVFGPFAATYSISIVAGGLMDFGSSQRMTRDLARTKDLGDLGSWLARRTGPQAVTTLALAIALLYLNPIPNASTATVILAMQAVTFSIALAFAGAVRAVRSPQLAAWHVAAGNSLLLTVALAAPREHFFLWCAGAASASWLLSSGLGAVSLRNSGSLFLRRSSGNPWINSAGLGAYGFATGLLALGVPVVTVIAGDQAAGNLAAVSRWVQPLVLLSLSYSAFMFPRFASYATDQEAIRHVRSAIPVVALAVVASGAMVALAPTLVRLLLGSDYVGAVNILRLSAVAVIPSILGQPLASLLQARGDDRFVGILGVTTSVGALAVTAALCNSIGAASNPVANGIASGVLLAGLVQRTRHLSARNQIGSSS